MQNAPKFSLKMLREGRSFLLFRSWPLEGSSAAFIHQLDLFRGDKRGNRRQPNLFERTSVSLGGLASWRRRSAGGAPEPTWLLSWVCCFRRRFSGVSVTMVKEVFG